MSYNKLIAIFSLDHDDFLSWLRENNIDSTKKFRGNDQLVLSDYNVLYRQLSNPMHTHGCTFDDFFITNRGKENPLYDKIYENFRPCLVQYKGDREKLKTLIK
mgnify:CR=1 FL=1